jgi:hypothetical protein
MLAIGNFDSLTEPTKVIGSESSSICMLGFVVFTSRPCNLFTLLQDPIIYLH